MKVGVGPLSIDDSEFNGNQLYDYKYLDLIIGVCFCK
jgi:hypothetical protein